MARNMPVTAMRPNSRAQRLPRVADQPSRAGSGLYRNGCRWASQPTRCFNVSRKFGMSHHLHKEVPVVDPVLEAVERPRAADPI